MIKSKKIEREWTHYSQRDESVVNVQQSIKHQAEDDQYETLSGTLSHHTFEVLEI